MEISQEVKDKISDVIELLADETLQGNPAILANATYFNMVGFLQNETDEINDIFKY